MEKYDWIIVAAAILFCLGLLGSVFVRQTVRSEAWGLSYEADGQPPAGLVTEEKLEGLGACYLGNPGGNAVYLTFDTGGGPGYTSQILETLRRHGAPGAFFLTEAFLKRCPDLVRRMVREGHTTGSQSGAADEHLTPEHFAVRRASMEEQFRALTGKPLGPFDRPVRGIFHEGTLKQARQLGIRTVFWSLAAGEEPGPEALSELLCRRLHPGAIVLLHTDSGTIAPMLDDLLTRWEALGFRFAALTGPDSPETNG